MLLIPMHATTVESPAQEAVFAIRGAKGSPGRSGGWSRSSPSLELVVGDITSETSDAIVNPAGGGLVDLAIRRVAGPKLLEALHRGAARLPGGRLRPGQALATQGFELAAAHVVHCHPPSYFDDPERARLDLASCHVEALRLARERGFASISFPAIATGAYRYPVPEAAEVAVSTVIAELRAHAAPGLVRFVLYGPAMLEVYLEAARKGLADSSA